MRLFFKAALLATCGVALSGCRGQAKNQEAENPVEGRRVVVCYFSATGTTRAQAEKLAKLLEADIYEIEPVEPYTEADLDWTDKNSRSTIEMNDPTSRPAIKQVPDSIADYDYVFLGYPNWWNLAPTVVNSFLDQANLDGVKVVPFMTSGGSSIENSEEVLHEAYPNIKWIKGRLLIDPKESTLSAWVKEIVEENK